MKIKTLTEILVSSQFSNEICNAKCLEAILQESNVTETEIEPECILKLKKVISNLCFKVNKKWKDSIFYYFSSTTNFNLNWATQLHFIPSECVYDLKLQM